LGVQWPWWISLVGEIEWLKSFKHLRRGRLKIFDYP